MKLEKRALHLESSEALTLPTLCSKTSIDKPIKVTEGCFKLLVG